MLALLIFSLPAWSQFNYTLTGTPVNTTGWTVGGSAYVSGNAIVLTNPVGTSSGYVYYNTPVNLTGCSQFTVNFEFSVTNSSSPPADGISFWYITTPPSGFVNGGGIGLPSNPTGLALLLDTYDNDGNLNNPLVSLRYLSGTNYVEGSTTGLLAPDVLYQSFITNGSWHTCQLIYNNGNISVSFDGNPPVMTGFYSISINGYFGFSASTGALYSNHSIRNVSIVGNTLALPVVTSPISYCQFEQPSALTAIGTNLKWYSTATGGVGSTIAPIPSTAVPDTQYYYVSQTVPGCGESNRDTIQVIVKAKPTPPNLNYQNQYCVGEPFVAFINQPSYLWYSAFTGGVGTNTAPTVSTSLPDSLTFFVSQTVDGCESDRATIPVKVFATPIVNFNYTAKYGCNSDTLVFQNLTTNSDSYQWDFGDGTGDTAMNPVHIYASQGVYNVRLKALNVHGCKDSTIQQIDINHPLQAVFNPNKDTICTNDNVTFINASNTAPNAVFYWDFGDGTADTTFNTNHTYTNPGSYTVRLIAQNFDLVNCQDTTYRIIQVDSFPVINFITSDSSLCEGKGVIFIGTNTKEGVTNVNWNFGDNTAIANQDPIAHSYDTSGIFTVTMHAFYRVCPDVTFTKDITIKPYPSLDLGPDTTMCPNGPAIVIGDFKNQFDPSAKWLWNTGDSTALIAVRHPGIYTAEVRINGCSTSDSIEVFKDCYIDIPNAFSPNNDGINDYFFPRQMLTEGIVKFKMNIFNRWGQIIFETTSINGRGWDGKFNDKDQPEGVYVYMIDVELKNDKTEHYTGNLTLLR